MRSVNVAIIIGDLGSGPGMKTRPNVIGVAPFAAAAEAKP